jgi:chorismate mutase
MLTPSQTRIRALRGATTIERDDAELLYAATRELLTELLQRNGGTHENVVSAFFTVTPDICTAFPAQAAREMGWHDVAMLCSLEIPVPGALERCIRVLLHLELPSDQRDIRHVYLREAERLRPDRC